jgi:toxin ParE1/3/4
MVKVIWTEIAIEDLRSIHEYISKDSELYADKLVEKNINRVSQLENFPKSGSAVPAFDSELILELFEGNYRIVYKTFTDKAAIVRVHHSARQLI